ncbi:hypothetical protein [Nonomuraea typhae]|uniref:hypothetical protein n=1 Tax=Nonomuraea typhae TaxID=2603600 RepID=UPI0012F8F4A9|nr:hypothetical protein [Nonomuraea typhae]
MSGDLVALSVAATGATAALAVRDGWLGPLLVGIAGLNAWMVWQVLRGPALPRGQGSPRGVVWVRRLLYAGIAADWVIWELLELLSRPAVNVASRLMWVVTVFLLLRAVPGVSFSFRAAALALCLIGKLGPAVMASLGFVPSAMTLMVLAGSGSTVMILLAQRRDGRWSGATIGIGWISLVAPMAFLMLTLVLSSVDMVVNGTGLVLSALDVAGTAWLARTAHELAAETGAPSAAPARGPRLLVAGALVLPLAVVGPEEAARFSFGAACDEPAPPYAQVAAQDRRKAFLCRARRGMFPAELPDQRILGYGARLCALPGAGERQALLRRVDGAGEEDEMDDALEFLCPEVIAVRRAGRAREQAEHERNRARAEAAWKARLATINARCADPWPKLPGRRQGTSAYLLFEGGGYDLYDDRDHGEGPAADPFKAIDDGFIDAAGGSAAVTTYGTNEPMCLTVKAYRAAPPLRLAGWDKVVEVGLVSRNGRLVVPPYPEGGDSGAIRALPNLAIAGPGRYRVRVYARRSEQDRDDPDVPAEEHLVVVYPGRSAERVVHRPWR